MLLLLIKIFIVIYVTKSKTIKKLVGRLYEIEKDNRKECGKGHNRLLKNARYLSAGRKII